MSRQVRFGIQLSGDHRGAVRSMQVTNQEARRLQGQIDRTSRSTRDVRSRFQGWAQSINGVRGAIGPLVGTVGASMLLRMSQQAIASTAALQDQADTAGLAVEQFQELTKGFQELGNIQENVTGGALRRFNRRFGLARQGMGAAADTLDRLNISLQQNTGDALQESLRLLARMEDSADRAAAASQLFGEDAGPRLAAALGKGEGALSDIIEELNRTGRIMSEDSVEAAAELDRRWNRLTDTIGTHARRAIVSTTGAFVDLHDFIRDELRSDFEALGIVSVDSAERAARAAEENKRELDEIFAERGGSRELAPVSVTAARPSPFEAGAQEARIKRFQDELKSLEDYGREWEEITPRIVSADEATERFLATLDPFERGTVRAFQDNITTLDEWAEQWGNITPRVKEAAEEIDNVGKATERTDRVTRDLGFTFQSSFEDAIIAGEGLRSVMQGLAEDIARIAIRESVTRPAGEAFAGMVAGAFTGGGGSGSAAAGGTGGARMNGFAKGGISSRPAIFGEAGPEAAVPLPDGRSIPVTMQGGGANVQINIHNAPRGTRREERTGPGGQRMVDIMFPVMDEYFDSGRGDRTVGGRYGLTPKARRS